jgi:adenosylcobyric acid synthase
VNGHIPPPGPHGDDAARVAAALGIDPAEILDLAQSMNPVAPSAARVVGRHVEALGTYPDPARAEAALAEAMGVERELVLLTNGGAEAIALVAADCRTGYVEQPEFSLYARHLETLDPAAGRWRSNPGNPTGRLCEPGQRAAVWDEAFFPLSTGSWTRGDHRSGSVVVGSLTKLLACPGLRIGYVIAPDRAVRDRLAGRQPRWSVNALAAAALPELLGAADLQAWSAEIAKLRGELIEVLGSHGLAVQPSDAPYVLVAGVVDLRQRLARERVVVRDCASFGLSGSFRIAVPAGDGLERLDRALAGALGGRSPALSRRDRADRPEHPAPRPERDRGGTVLRGALMVCGTSSDAGKSQIVAGICRALSRRGVSVAPFKGQNMSLNSFATPAGHEIGRAQGMQAMAARATPEVSMNPVLLKPTGERRSQVVVMGRPVAELDAREYQRAKPSLRPTVLAALSGLRAHYDVVILEGAGSPAEINLLDGDLVNLGLAAEADVPAILLGDIERGGVFASLYGTVALLPGRLRQCLRGFAVNKLRGDPSLLESGLVELERRTGLASLGVIPWVEGLSLDAEDSLALDRSPAGWGARATGAAAHGHSIGPSSGSSGDVLDVAVVRLPRIANFTDLDALAIEPAVAVRSVFSPAQLGSPDLVFLPGSKTTVADLAWLRESGLASALSAAVEAPGGPVLLGVCAGYQMLGEWIDDDVESEAGRVPGLGMLAVRTSFGEEKVTLPRRGSALGADVTGYEIRQGRPVVGDGSQWIELAGAGAIGGVAAGGGRAEAGSVELEGASGRGGRVVGTSLHGLFESDAFRTEFLRRIAARAGKAFSPSGVSFAAAREAQFELLADLVEQYLDVESLWDIIASCKPGGESR